MSDVQIVIQREEWADPAVALPHYETDGAAGADIRAQLPQGPVTLRPGQRALIATGLRMAIAPGHEVQIRPRSGLALRDGITLVNTPGTIDCDYRGPVGVIVINHGHDDVVIGHGDRIAQMVVAPVTHARFVETDSLPPTARGESGFGSTGLS